MFNNATSHFIYAKNKLQVAHINKGSSDQQLFLWPSWYTILNKEWITQKISTNSMNPITRNFTIIQREIWVILVKKELWLLVSVQLVLVYEILKW